MNATLYSLCHDSFVGPLLWIASLCASPPPLKDAAISVSTPGNALSTKVQVPVSKSYFLTVAYTFSSTEDRLKDTLIGTGQVREPCYGRGAKHFDAYPEDVRARLGKPLRLKLSVKDVATNAVIYSASLASVCPAGHDGAAKKTQVLALIELPAGLWAVNLENVESRQDLVPLRPTLTIHPGGK